MAEVILGAVLLAIALYFIARSAKDRNGFVRHSSRGAFMRDLNKAIESERSQNQ